MQVELPERDATQGRRKRWPWIVGTVIGVIAGGITLLALSFGAWFDAGGTFGGFGAAADSDVDWGRLDTLMARRIWIAVLVAAAVPVGWAITRLIQAEDDPTRRQAQLWLGGILVAVVFFSLLSPLMLWRARATATEPDPDVVAAFEEASPVPVERTLDKPTEEGPWQAVYRAEGFVDAEWTVDGGTWWCETSPYDDIRWFEADGDWTEVWIVNDGTTVSPADSGPTWPDVVECVSP